MAIKRRLYVSVYFSCCTVYQRIYRRPEERRYVGRCPRCLRKVEITVDPLGTDERFFEAYREV
jgi:hypothetical protein